MISAKKLIGMVRKQQEQAAMGRVDRISLPTATAEVHVESCSKASLVEKGHFVIYTFDQKRFVILLAYLINDIFRELIKLSEEEFGLSSDEPITLPCNAAFMTCIVSLIKRGTTKGLDYAFLDSIITLAAHFLLPPLRNNSLLFAATEQLLHVVNQLIL